MVNKIIYCKVINYTFTFEHMCGFTVINKHRNSIISRKVSFYDGGRGTIN